ncbi:hypothetical protein D7X94_11700 [Acutalibacter sp. 1XD8-33]|nr:hypothetical protein D7X94_11700 [Acutalibacter sp. 1XD8-33]
MKKRAPELFALGSAFAFLFVFEGGLWARRAPLGFVLRTNRRENGLCPFSHGHFAACRKMRAGYTAPSKCKA